MIKTETEYHLPESNPRTEDERLRYNQVGQSAEIYKTNKAMVNNNWIIQ